MARRRRGGRVRRIYTKAKRRISRSKKFDITKQIVPIGVVAFAEPQINALLRQYVGGFAPGLPVPEAVEVVLGSYMAKRSGLVGNAGRAMATVALTRAMQQLLTGQLLAGSGSTNGGPSF